MLFREDNMKKELDLQKEGQRRQGEGEQSMMRWRGMVGMMMMGEKTDGSVLLLGKGCTMTLASALGWTLDIVIQIEAVKQNEELGRLR